MINPNLRGDIRVRGEKIEDFINNIIKKSTANTSTAQVAPTPTAVQTEESNELKILREQLAAFNDEKVIISTTMEKMTEKVTALENLVLKITEEKHIEFKNEIKKVMDKVASVSKSDNDVPMVVKKISDLENVMEKKLTDMKPRRGVDQATLDGALSEVRQEVKQLAVELSRLRDEVTEDA